MRETALAIFRTLTTSLGVIKDSLVGATPEKHDQRMHDWARYLIERAQIQVAVSGEPVDWSRTYIVMSNHQSHFDIPVIVRAVPGRMRMVAKKELFYVPIFGQAIRAAGFVEIDRRNREKAIASLKLAGEKIRQGTNIWIAPEGTRSLTGKLGPLKKGGFMLAKEVGAPILPMAIVGTREILPPKTRSIRRGKTVRVVFGKPIDPADKTPGEMMDEVRRFLAKHLPG
ncbi:MAG: 1-acyl-sn-glycerol-3-phosphate acyltransferase [Deltaproteobacteria bacterium]|nr:1-acyl-sn-glycerol-3-phosphate acyltransferase [Deltaproteobacteria bacterium]